MNDSSPTARTEESQDRSPDTQRWWDRFGWPPKAEAEYNEWWLAKIKLQVVVDSAGCWLWPGRLTSNGYGQTAYRCKTAILHRKMFEVFHGITLQRLEYICHSCDVKRCCNPAHLWKGNNGLNKKDETAKGRNYWANRTHCPRGHEYTPENIRYHKCRPGVISRGCLTCERERMKSPAYVAWRRAYQRKRRAEKRAARIQEQANG